MKPKELLYSLDHVGEDLLAEAEQTVLVRRRRPWTEIAAAAVLIAAIGAGGFFLWRSLRSGGRPAATGEDPSAVTIPSFRPDDKYTVLPLLSVGDSWTGGSRARFDDLEASLAGSLASEYEGLTSLPVYEREVAPDGAVHIYNENELYDRLSKAADWLGASFVDSTEGGYHDNWAYQYQEVDGITYLDSLFHETDQGTLTVYADGRIQMLYDEAHSYKSPVEVEFPMGTPQEEAERILRYARMQDCGKKLAERLGLGECGFVPCDRWDPSSSAWTAYTLYPLREDPAERLVSRWFERVQMLTNDGETLRGFVADRFPDELDVDAPGGLRLLGNYPIITPDDAISALYLDAFLCEEKDLARDTVCSNVLWEQLVYLPEAGHDLLMPYYRFWLSADEAGTADGYIAVYVPAVRENYCADWEMYRSIRLPTITVGEVGQGVGALLLTDPEAYLASNPWREKEQINTLPVYRLPETGAQDAAMFFFAEEDRFAPACGAGLEGPERSEELIRAFAAQVVAKAGLNPDLSWNVVEGVYPLARTLSGAEAPLYAAEVYAASDYPGSRILNYCLQRVTLWYRDGTLWGFSLPRYALTTNLYDYLYAGEPKTEAADPGAAESELPAGVPTELTQIGYYPVISPAQARELAFLGQYVGRSWELPAENSLSGQWISYENTDELMLDLVYLPNEAGDYLMPFYRFLFPVKKDGETGVTVCEAWYVPAVTDLYLADYPPEPVEPEDPGDPDGPAEPAEGSLSELALEPLDPSADVGVGISLLRNDAELAAFYTYFGLFAFDGTSRDLLFAIDLDKAVDRQGNRQIQGDGPRTDALISEDGKTILVLYSDGEAEGYADVCSIDLENRTYRKLSSIPSDFSAASLREPDQAAWGWDESSRLSDLWILHDKEKWYPFRTN